MKRHKTSLMLGLILGGTLLILAACDSGIALVGPAAPTTTAPADVVVVATPTPMSEYDVAEQRIIDVYQRVSPSVVNITTQVMRSSFFFGVYPEEGSGSGFVYDEDGHIITNYHLVDQADEIVVSFDEGQEMPARVVGVDPPNDLAVIKVDQLPPGAVPLPLGDSDKLEVGQRAIAIGNPFGQFERTLTVGVVSAVNRSLELDVDRVLRGVIQTDASINRGNSGGPLLDSSGRLIGVNTAIFSPSGTSAGVGLAIPVNKVKRVVPVLIATGSFPHPWLGIEGLGYPVYPELAQVLDLPVDDGLLIARMTQGSPAQQAGIRAATNEVVVGRRRILTGGDILVSVDGHPLHTWEDLDAYLQEQTEVGQTVTLTLWRSREKLEIQVMLGQQPG